MYYYSFANVFTFVFHIVKCQTTLHGNNVAHYPHMTCFIYIKHIACTYRSPGFSNDATPKNRFTEHRRYANEPISDSRFKIQKTLLSV